MESRFISQDGMDNDAQDLNVIQDHVQSAMEHVVGDGITDDRKFAGFASVATGTAEVTVAAGRLYSSGRVYNRDADFVKDFTTSLPVATKKIVLVVVWGSEVETNSVPREFLINEETGASEPRVVATELARVANINVASGTESPDPVDPIVDAGVLPVARIILTPTGVQSVELIAENKLDSVKSVAARTKSLEGFRDVAAPQIVSLASDLATLKVASQGNVNQAVYGRMLARLAVIEEQAGIPSNAADSDCDFFLDTEESDLTHVNFLAKVEEGIRFADENANESVLAIFDGLNPRAKITGGVMLPAYSRSRRLAVGPRQGEVQVSAYSYQTNQMVQKTMARQRVRYGEEFTVCTNSAWWQTGQYDYLTSTFARAGETFEVSFTGTSYGRGHEIMRARRYWVDVVQETYWDSVTINHAVPGAQVAETFLNSNDMWLDAVGLTFTRLAASGGITLAIVEVENGAPKLDAAICVTSVDRASLVLNSETVISIQPTFLEGGKRYAIVVISAADHWLATTQGTNFPQGTFFYVLDGAYQQGDGTRDLCFNLYAAKFTSSRAVIEMSPLSLSGGITSLDILADAVVPDSTQMTYEIQVGSVWHPVAAVTESVLGAGGNIPPLVPLRIVFTGTPDVMPAVKLTGSRVRVSRPRTSLVHITKERTLPAPSTQIRVIGRLEYFDAVHHTATAKLRTGAGFDTIVNASSFSDVTADDGSIERTWLFNLGAAVSAYKIQCEATTDSALRTFHYGWRKDYAL